LQQLSVFPTGIRSGDAVLNRTNGERHQVAEVAMMLRLRDVEGWHRATDYDKIIEPWHPPKTYQPGQQWRAPPGAGFVFVGAMTAVAAAVGLAIWIEPWN
jgi:hypothetical protein